MNGLVKKSIELIARILLLYTQEGKVIPRDYMNLEHIAHGNWSEVE